MLYLHSASGLGQTKSSVPSLQNSRIVRPSGFISCESLSASGHHSSSDSMANVMQGESLYSFKETTPGNSAKKVE